jgi:hypothetical protein
MEQNLTIPEIQKQLHYLKIKIGLMNKDYAKSDGGNRGADFKAIQVANVQRVDLEGQLARAQNANPKARPFIGPVSPTKQPSQFQTILDKSNTFLKPKQKANNPPLQYVPNIQDIIHNPNKAAVDWNKNRKQEEEYARTHPTSPPRTGKIRLRVHDGEIKDWGVGHSWVVVDWSDGRKESIELQPQGHLFGGGPQDDVLLNHKYKDGTKEVRTIDRKFDNELAFPFDENKWTDLNKMKNTVKNKNWSIFNNCTDMPIDVIRNVTGHDFGDFGPEMPGTLSKRIMLYKMRKKTK